MSEMRMMQMDEKILEQAKRVFASHTNGQRTPEGWLPIEAWTNGQRVIVLGSPADTEDLPEDQWHNCDVMRCSSVGSHVVGIFDLPAPVDLPTRMGLLYDLVSKKQSPDDAPVRKIYQDEGAGDWWVATNLEDAIRQYESRYGPDPITREEGFFREIPADEVVRMVMVDQRTVAKELIPDGGIVRDEEYLMIEATAERWLAHLPADVSEPWLSGDW